MNQNSRTSNVIRNLIGGVGGQIFTSILSFVCRTYFIKLLGATYLGVNGLFANILSLLSLAELGIGPAIIFSMYKPIKDNDEAHIARLMNFYKTAYRIIACIVTACGLILLPFLPYLIKDTSGIDNLRLIFILILANTSVSYLFAYKGSMLNADQKSYICVIFRNVFAVVQNIAQILLLIWTGNFLLYLIAQIITTFMANFVQAIYVDKKYPFLVKYKALKIDKEEQKSIMRNVKGMMMHKVGGFVLNGTDNLVISKFVGVIAVGIYSNYLMIINLVKTYVAQLTGATSASVGNLIAGESCENTYRVFKSLFFIYAWIYAFCFVCFWVIFQPFIGLWLGGEYLLDEWTLFIVLINFFLNGLQECINTFTNATGLFWATRKKPIFECIINIGVSLFLAYFIGLPGVFLGTLASFLATFWINPKVMFKEHFQRKVAGYFLRFALYTVLAVGMGLGLNALCNLFLTDISFWNVVIRIGLCLIVPNIIWMLIFFKTAEFKYCLNIGKRIIRKILKKVSKKKDKATDDKIVEEGENGEITMDCK